MGFAYAAREASRRRRLALAIAIAAVLAGYSESAVQSVPPEPSAISQAVSMLRSASHAGSYVLATDQPIVSFLGHRRVPAPLVDTSWVRLLSGSLTRREILAVAHANHVVAVLAGARLLSSAATRNGLHRLFPRQVQIASNSTLYLPAARGSNR